MRTVLCTSSQDALAKKYCFKATAVIRVIRTGKVVYSIVGHDKSPGIAKTVAEMCQERAALDTGLDPGQVMLTIFEECPVECDITVIEYPEDA